MQNRHAKIKTQTIYVNAIRVSFGTVLCVFVSLKKKEIEDSRNLNLILLIFFQFEIKKKPRR